MATTLTSDNIRKIPVDFLPPLKRGKNCLSSEKMWYKEAKNQIFINFSREQA